MSALDNVLHNISHGQEVHLDERIRRIHFIGVGGVGMSGIAEVFKNQGYDVTGSDISDNAATKRLKSLGVQVFHEHKATNIENADIVVYSSDIVLDENVESVAAREARIPLVPRAQMLAELMRNRYGIAIAGTHGKTTTTSLTASILAEGGLDPTFVIGGLLNSAASNARLGTSRYLVAEADESDASFLYLKPRIAVVTNIDADHMWSYDNNFDQLRQTFITFLHHLPVSGLAVLCIDDPVVREILPQVARPIITYGFSEDADIRIENFRQEKLTSYFTLVIKKDKTSIDITASLAGRHNALNTAASVAVALELGVGAEAINKALQNFQGIGRRLQVRGEYAVAGGSALVVDDYGHHPREIQATVEAVRLAWPDRRLVLAFQPHRFSRTQSLFEDFTQVLSLTDKLVLFEIYPAREAPIPNITSKALCRAIRERGQVEPIYLARDEKLTDILPNILLPNDVLLLQGAGDIGAIAASLPLIQPQTVEVTK